jgi:hypothetical protein
MVASSIFNERSAPVERADGFCRHIHGGRLNCEDQAGRKYSFRTGTAYWPKRAGLRIAQLQGRHA